MTDKCQICNIEIVKFQYDIGTVTPNIIRLCRDCMEFIYEYEEYTDEDYTDEEELDIEDYTNEEYKLQV